MKNNNDGLNFTKIDCADNLAAVEDSIYVLGGKWKLRIIVALVSGHKRFNEIQRAVKGISPRVLSNELKALELNGLVKRVVDAKSIPVLVEYESTEYSETLKDIVSMLGTWGRNHKKRIVSNI